MKIIIFDANDQSTAKLIGVDCDVHNDQKILEDILGLSDLVSNYQEVVFTTNIFNKALDSNIKKIQRQVVNIVDTCLFLNKPLTIVAPFTPYYGNTQLKTISERAINESTDLDEFSLLIHIIAQEVERGRQEGGLVTYIRSGFDLTINDYALDLSQRFLWRSFPIFSKTKLIHILSKQLTYPENPNSNYIYVDSFLTETDIPTIVSHKESLFYKLKKVFSKEKYTNSLPIQIEPLLSSSI